MSSRLVFFQVSPRRHSNKVTFQGTKYRQTGYLKVVLGCIFHFFFFYFVAETRTARGRNSHHHWRSSVWTASGKMRVGTGGRGEADFVFTTTMLDRTFDTNMTMLLSPSCCSRSHTPWRRFTRCAVFSCIFVYKWSVYMLYFFFCPAWRRLQTFIHQFIPSFLTLYRVTVTTFWAQMWQITVISVVSLQETQLKPICPYFLDITRKNSAQKCCTLWALYLL